MEQLKFLLLSDECRLKDKINEIISFRLLVDQIRADFASKFYVKYPDCSFEDSLNEIFSKLNNTTFIVNNYLLFDVDIKETNNPLEWGKQQLEDITIAQIWEFRKRVRIADIRREVFEKSYEELCEDYTNFDELVKHYREKLINKIIDCKKVEDLEELKLKRRYKQKNIAPNLNFSE